MPGLRPSGLQISVQRSKASQLRIGSHQAFFGGGLACELSLSQIYHAESIEVRTNPIK
ncbi:Hypothetical protein FKW44_024393 [Caligus rogercresseyi]|uniref:Uncharacterized protein n=1 Tax=Caligus rogercresseyi TaxID=217165 RepID=A0A7T8JTD1_CALRO|nr:Hypothetical protein FKW44_024393 [Caligus rogercresseyi]